MAEESRIAPDGQTPGSESWLSVGVVGVGAASLFSDSGHEMTTSLLPTLFTSVLHGSAAGLGIVEGVSDALMGVAKLASGPLANQPNRRSRFAVGGYLGTALATGAIGSATGLWQVGILRSLAWIARGVRSPARDSLLAQLAPEHAYGRAYGVERAGDNVGAIVGPLLAAVLVGLIGVRSTLWLAAVPGAFAAVAIYVAAKETRHSPRRVRQVLRLNLAELRRRSLARPMVPVVFFECGNAATTLLILRTTQLLHASGRTLVYATSLAIVIYAAHNACAAVVALWGGRSLDRSGPRSVFALGAALYVGAYLLFAIGPHEWYWLLLAFSFAGSGIGLAETSESTLVARALPDSLRGSGFGLLGGVQALGDVVSTVTVGILYVVFSPFVAFAYAAAWMFLSLSASSWLVASSRWAN
jgi:MFS family permease